MIIDYLCLVMLYYESTFMSIAMNDLPEKVKDLVKNSVGRAKIVEAVCSFKETFTIKDVANYLEANEFKFPEEKICVVLRALCLRGFLTVSEPRVEMRRGRFTKQYEKVSKVWNLIN